MLRRLTLLLIVFISATAYAADRRPNILIILVDDMGWRDLSVTGSTFYETPNIDRIAHDGMRFTQAYAACPVCSPSRASLLTGHYPATLNLTD
jgi:arylsulfatase A